MLLALLVLDGTGKKAVEIFVREKLVPGKSLKKGMAISLHFLTFFSLKYREYLPCQPCLTRLDPLTDPPYNDTVFLVSQQQTHPFTIKKTVIGRTESHQADAILRETRTDVLSLQFSLACRTSISNHCQIPIPICLSQLPIGITITMVDLLMQRWFPASVVLFCGRFAREWWEIWRMARFSVLNPYFYLPPILFYSLSSSLCKPPKNVGVF